MKILVTGGAGFIGSTLIRYLIRETDDRIVNVDKLTYAACLQSLSAIEGDPRYTFEHLDICDQAALEEVFRANGPDAVIHLAAESHVDRSINGPAAFIQSNIIGTYSLMETCRRYRDGLPADKQQRFRVLHVSTDEVYGDLDGREGKFREDSPYAPSSPYSASKASADHIARAWQRTYSLPVLISNCSNNYGPYQHPEKLIPLTILNALEGKPIPIYGAGDQIRDWLFVEDHARALSTLIRDGQVGETYNIGGHNEKRNIDVVSSVCRLLDDAVPSRPGGVARFADLIKTVEDRPGHDRRYAIDASKAERELGWVPRETFDSGLEKTVRWYLANRDWCRSVADGAFQEWCDIQYGTLA